MIRFLQTPGPIKKIVLGGMLLIICAAMVVTLVPGGLGDTFGFGGPRAGVLATVSGVDVTTLEVQRAADQMLRQQSQRSQGDLSFMRPFFAQRAADQLITQKVIVAEAARMGLRATDEEVRDELQHGQLAATFFPGGNFIGQTEYEARLQAAGMTTTQFEQAVKDQILADKLRNLVAGSATVTDAEVRKEFGRQNTKVKIEYAVLDKDPILKSIKPSDAELKTFYERNKAAYNNSIPEKRKLRYAVIDTGRLQAETQVTPADLQSYYDQHRDDYRVAEQVNVRQIVIKTPLPGPDGKVDPKGVDEARKRADDVLKQLKAGAQFADLAKKYSEDPSSSNGGSIGWVEHGRFPVPAVENAAFSLPKGGTSDVIDAGYAFNILHIDDKQPAHVKPLEEVKTQIEPAIKQQKAAGAAEAQVNALLSQARGGGLDKAATAKGVPVISTDFVSRNDSLPGIGHAPQFMDAAFSQPEKSPPDQAQLPQGFAVFEVVEVKPPSTPAFEEIRPRLEAEFRNERGAALLSQKTQELADRAKASHDLKKAAKELGATIKTSEFVAPDGQVPDIGSMSGPAAVAFGMGPGEISAPIASADSGIVLTVVQRQEPTQQDFEAKKDEVRDSLVQNRQNEVFGLFLSNLREQMKKTGKIKINEQEMKGLTRTPGGEEGG